MWGNLWGNLGGPLSCPSFFALTASRRQPFPAISPLTNPHGQPPILRHYVQSSPHLFDRSSIAKQNLSHRANVICDGSPSRIRSVRRISLGMTTRPRSSMRRTIPVAFIVAPPMLFILPRFWLQGYCLQRKEKYSGVRRRRAVRIKKAKAARGGFGF